ncbi:MAG TPA: alpha/beta fold hydrolase [Gemmatimonadales bacterium]|nr:alpha/beta fold hydrolase [Gemmatimonadales bacterium]
MTLRGIASSIAIAGLVVACTSDSGTGPTTARSGGPVEHQQLQDPNINPNDTYVVLDAASTNTGTITYDTQTVNPTTGQSVTSVTMPSPLASEFHVEIGYDVNGILRADVTGTWPIGTDSTSVSVPDAYRVVLSNGQLTEYNAAGAVLAPSTLPSDSEPAGSSFLNQLGNQLLHGVLTNGVLVDSLQAVAAPPSPSGSLITFSRILTTDANHRSIVATGPGLVGRGWGNKVKGYHRDGSKWVLDSIAGDYNSASNGFSLHTHQVLRLKNVQWNVNPAMDSSRNAFLAANPGPHIGRDTTSQTSLGNVRGILERQQCAPGQCGDGGGGGTGGGTGGGGTPPPPGQNIVFQHGLFNAGGVWSRMDGWLAPEFSFGTTLLPSLSATARAQTQTDQLISDVAATGQTHFLIVGHSMGGLIARRAAQERPDLFSGVLTVGTPHVGAFLALQSKAVIANILTYLANELWYGCTSYNEDPGCAVAYFVASVGVSAAVEFAANALVPANIDLQPGSAFTTALNTATETFPRVGIESYSPKRWVLARLGGDSQCFPENPTCGGRAWAKYANDAYWGARLLQILGAMVGNETIYDVGTRIVDVMDYIDYQWDWWTAPGDQTDGVVQGRSQVYPRATANLSIPGGDSHDGEPNSDKTRTKIEQAFDQVFLVPRLN